MGPAGLMKRVVLDTNVVVSALLFRGVTSQIHDLWRDRAILLLISDHRLAELARVLAYPKFKLGQDGVTALLAAEILPFSERVAPNRAPPAGRDPADNEFLRCARDGVAQMLVTGDPNLLALRPSWGGVPILTVSEALPLLRHIVMTPGGS